MAFFVLYAVVYKKFQKDICAQHNGKIPNGGADFTVTRRNLDSAGGHPHQQAKAGNGRAGANNMCLLARGFKFM
jgi:hypothetical protein